jgi:hypothetical protein
MMALKVYGGTNFAGGRGQVWMIVATTSWKCASELTRTSLSYLKTYWSITGNETDVEIAMSEPETVFYIPLDAPHDEKRDKKNWKRLEGN